MKTTQTKTNQSFPPLFNYILCYVVHIITMAFELFPNFCIEIDKVRIKPQAAETEQQFGSFITLVFHTKCIYMTFKWCRYIQVPHLHVDIETLTCFNIYYQDYKFLSHYEKARLHAKYLGGRWCSKNHQFSISVNCVSKIAIMNMFFLLP